jgi:type IV secretory pathway VirJ component
MPITDQLASARGERGQEANCAVAEQCLERPELLSEIVEGLSSRDARLAGDCAEVMTKVAEGAPDLAAPYASQLAALLAHKNGRVRWEVMHAFALVAGLVPDLTAERLEWLRGLIRDDKSVIVRDYAVDAVAAYAATGATAAKASLPVLQAALEAWDGKYAARALAGLARAAQADPSLAAAVRASAEPFTDHARPGVRKAARATLRAAGGDT